ncbi:MAG: sigma-70 family RNA polymerase sigma factor [Deltaproteobacteria bacterium]|nr:sigma-70 family RNA polymerase sigma factor [Deltaproteobacteria bacterium]MBK8239721.1 sigma-70 family RNA polymerase sigma factor [Deltaproteobacteria bacterium]MBK8714456.1 sigma-70 family RNA polymerase sigma factor [Deltaproteobacteria bacterium]MBP7288216.1 sigma-70 family RNA polymerase sigma factor [Nannocystaceae bacterium]
MTARTLDAVPWLADLAEGALERAAAESSPASVPWDRLIEQHGRRVVVALLARGLPLERAKDLADDAWVRIIQQHRAGRLPELKIPGIVIMQALFLARDAQRIAMRRANVETRIAGDWGMHGEPPDVEHQLLARAQLRKVAKVVEAASPTARRVFELSYGDPQKSAGEVAEEIGISLQRVRQITCELRKRIRGVLGGPSDD